MKTPVVELRGTFGTGNIFVEFGIPMEAITVREMCLDET